MARGIAFRHLPGNSFLHRWDARCKLIGLCSITMALLHAGRPILTCLTGILLAVVWAAKLPVRSLMQDLRGWMVLLALVFGMQALDTGGESTRVAPWLPATQESLGTAMLSVWRLTLILAFSVLFSLATRAKEMQGALLWVMSPFPFLPARRIALMTGLVIRFLPLILDVLEEVKAANRSRMGDRVRSPIRRIQHLTIPVLRRSLRRADDLAVALAARGYREDIKPAVPPIPLWHLAPLPLLLALGLVSDSLSTILLRTGQQSGNLLLNLLQRL